MQGSVTPDFYPGDKPDFKMIVATSPPNALRASTRDKHMAGGSYVGLDIGSNLMKVAQVRRTGKGLEVTNLGLAPTPPEAFDNSVIIDVQALSKAVKDLLKSAGISGGNVISSISGQSAVVVRVIEVPQMAPAELTEAMKWEVERQVPFASGAGAGVISDFVAIDRPEGYAPGQNMDVLLAAAQQDVVDRHVEMLFAAGLKPKAIDVEPLASGRTMLELSGTPQQPGHTSAIFNIGASVTDVSIYRDKLLTFSRSLPVAGDNFTRAIADYLQVDLATAETYKREQGEVILDQFGQQAAPDFGAGGGGFGGGAGGGFINFGEEQVPNVTTDASPSGRTPFIINAPGVPTGPSSPSGRMPFDFSTPGEAPPPPPPAAEGGFYNPGAPQSPGFFDPDASPSVQAAFPQSAQLTPSVPVQSSHSAPQDQMKQQIFSALSPVLVELSQELRRSLDYFRSKSGDAPVHEIILVGGTAKLRGIATYLEMELGIATRVGDPLQNVMVTSKTFSEQHLQEIASLFPVSIGLGARDLIETPGSKGKNRR